MLRTWRSSTAPVPIDMRSYAQRGAALLAAGRRARLTNSHVSIGRRGWHFPAHSPGKCQHVAPNASTAQFTGAVHLFEGAVFPRRQHTYGGPRRRACRSGDRCASPVADARTLARQLIRELICRASTGRPGGGRLAGRRRRAAARRRRARFLPGSGRRAVSPSGAGRGSPHRGRSRRL